MSTHSPLPWIVEGNMIRQPMLSKRRRIICPPDHDGIQDAAFIVRACNAHEELLEVLKAASHDGRLQTFEDRERFRLAAQIAIAKAEGRRP